MVHCSSLKIEVASLSEVTTHLGTYWEFCLHVNTIHLVWLIILKHYWGVCRTVWPSCQDLHDATYCLSITLHAHIHSVQSAFGYDAHNLWKIDCLVLLVPFRYYWRGQSWPGCPQLYLVIHGYPITQQAYNESSVSLLYYTTTNHPSEIMEV